MGSDMTRKLLLDSFMMPLTDREAVTLYQDEEQAKWADYGRSVYTHLMAENAIEQVFTRASLQPGQTTKGIGRAIRAYLLTGTKP